MVIVALVVLAVVVYVATGRGGELAAENTDHAPLDMGPVSATDVVLLRPPTALWGYSVQATDEALDRIAEAIRERDVRIVALEQLVTDLSHDPSPQPLSSPLYMGARHRRSGALAGEAPAGEQPGLVRERGFSGGVIGGTSGDDGAVPADETSASGGGTGMPPEQSHD